MVDEEILAQVVAGHPCYDLVEVQDSGVPSILIRMSARHEKRLFISQSAVGVLGRALTRLAEERGWQA